MHAAVTGTPYRRGVAPSKNIPVMLDTLKLCELSPAVHLGTLAPTVWPSKLWAEHPSVLASHVEDVVVDEGASRLTPVETGSGDGARCRGPAPLASRRPRKSMSPGWGPGGRSVRTISMALISGFSITCSNRDVDGPVAGDVEPLHRAPAGCHRCRPRCRSCRAPCRPRRTRRRPACPALAVPPYWLAK